MDLDEAMMEAEEAMEKVASYLKHELQGVRGGQVTTSLVEFVKIDYYGSPTELRQLASTSVTSPTQLLIKPYDASALQAIVKGIQAAGLGLNPMSEGKQVRITVPPLSGERRKQYVQSVRQMGESAKVTIRNARREANKLADQAEKDKTLHVSEDDIKGAKTEVQDLVKNYENRVQQMIDSKINEIQGV
jgi:ribosome recycling factor